MHKLSGPSPHENEAQRGRGCEFAALILFFFLILCPHDELYAHSLTHAHAHRPLSLACMCLPLQWHPTHAGHQL